MPKPSRRSAPRPGDRGDDGPAGLARLDRPHDIAVGPVGPFPAAIWGITAFGKFRGDELLVHGLAGPARSPYVVRVAARLVGFWLGANLALKLAAEADVAPRAGLAFHAADNPFIPADPFRCLNFPPGLALELNSLGGHLGYFSRNPWGGDRRRLDVRLTT